MEHSVDEALEQADVDNDGYITWTEYMDAVHKNETENPSTEHHENENTPNELNQNDHQTTTTYVPPHDDPSQNLPPH